jgi:hypothetical protein
LRGCRAASPPGTSKMSVSRRARRAPYDGRSWRPQRSAASCRACHDGGPEPSTAGGPSGADRAARRDPPSCHAGSLPSELCDVLEPPLWAAVSGRRNAIHVAPSGLICALPTIADVSLTCLLSALSVHILMRSIAYSLLYRFTDPNLNYLPPDLLTSPVAGRAAACNGWLTERGRPGGGSWPGSMCRPQLPT